VFVRGALFDELVAEVDAPDLTALRARLAQR